MKWNLIQTKVLAALLVCLFVGVVGILALMNYSFVHNSQALAGSPAIRPGSILFMPTKNMPPAMAVMPSGEGSRDIRPTPSARDSPSRFVVRSLPISVAAALERLKPCADSHSLRKTYDQQRSRA